MIRFTAYLTLTLVLLISYINTVNVIDQYIEGPTEIGLCSFIASLYIDLGNGIGCCVESPVAEAVISL